MKLISRIATGAATAAVGLALAVGPATAAFADGPDTSKRTVEKIEAAPWVVLKEGDAGYRVEAVRCFVDQLGYYKDGCAPRSEGGDIFTEELTAGLEEYQADNDLTQSGELDAKTWSALRDDTVNVKRGDARPDVVKGVQESLNHLTAADLDVDGNFGAGTEKAVKEFQGSKDIDDDGIVGRSTFRAMFAKGAENQPR